MRVPHGSLAALEDPPCKPKHKAYVHIAHNFCLAMLILAPKFCTSFIAGHPYPGRLNAQLMPVRASVPNYD
jgi:hypothetical protein